MGTRDSFRWGKAAAA